MARRRKRRSRSISEAERIIFSTLNEYVVQRLIREGIVAVPQRTLDIPKDLRWNEKILGSRILQGILNGDGIPKISNSLMDVIGSNRASAVRNARTMTTSAECAGRLDSYRELESQGVVERKVWIATPDGRTRDSHFAIDGEEVEIERKFSNGCRYPGDAQGPAEEVWNCRCSMRSHIVGFRRADGSISFVDYKRDETLHDQQMREQREVRNGRY